MNESCFHEEQSLILISFLQALAERYMGHSTSEVMDDNGLMLFNLVDQNAVGCWNSLLPYSPINHGIIARHDEALLFPCDVKVHFL